MMFQKNKRAQVAEQLASGGPFFFLMFVILAGIVIGSVLFFGSGYDSRKADANFLNYKIQGCLLNGNLDKISGDFYKSCSLNKDAVENNKIMIKVCKGVSQNDCITEENSVFYAGSNFQACKFIGVQKNKAYLKCTIKEIYVNGVLFSIITGSNQQVTVGATK